MNFGDPGEPEQPALVLPDIRTFTVRRFEPIQEAQGIFKVEELNIASHSVALEESGALSFVVYVGWKGQVIPQKHRIFRTWIDVEEQIQPKPSRLSLVH